MKNIFIELKPLCIFRVKSIVILKLRSTRVMTSDAVSSGFNAGKLDMSLVNIDLTRASLDAAGSNMVTIAREVLMWLGRERINEQDYQYCVENTKGLAYPNVQGQSLRDRLWKHNAQTFIGRSLALVQSGAIGRWMVLSTDHSYLVTTTVIASRFHHLAEIPDLLYEIVLASGNAQFSKSGPPEPIIKVRLLRVLNKIVESIALNVVNVGHSVNDFPEELHSQCQSHMTDSKDFGRIVKELQRPGQHLILLCEYFQADLIMWALNHFHGMIDVCIARKILYKTSGDGAQNRLEILICNKCPEKTAPRTEGPGCCDMRQNIQLLEQVASSQGRPIIDRLRYGRKAKTYTGESPAKRHELYSIRSLARPDRQGDLSLDEMKRTNWLSQQLVAWLVTIPISEEQRHSDMDVVFDVDVFSNQAHISEPHLRVGQLFARSPMILNFDTGYKPGSVEDFEVSSEGVCVGGPCRPTEEILIDRFAAIRRFINDIEKRCKCISCSGNGSWGGLGDGWFEGCLKYIAITNIQLKVGHAIADGFGVPDASGLLDKRSYCMNLMRLFKELDGGLIEWETWFTIALSTALGIDSHNSYEEGPSRFLHTGTGFDLLVGAQHGSLIAMAKWIDLDLEMLQLRGVFSLQLEEGRVQGIEDESTVIRAYDINTHGDDEGCRKAWQELNKWVWDPKSDTSPAYLQHAVFAAFRSYRLLTVVSCADSRKPINLSYSLTSLVQSVKIPRPCTHKFEELSEMSNSNNNSLHRATFRVFDFSALLTNWYGNDAPEGDNFHITKALDSNVKVNAALSCNSNLRCMLIDGHPQFCWRCLVEQKNREVGEDETLRVIIKGPEKEGIVVCT